MWPHGLLDWASGITRLMTSPPGSPGSFPHVLHDQQAEFPTGAEAVTVRPLGGRAGPAPLRRAAQGPPAEAFSA